MTDSDDEYAAVRQLIAREPPHREDRPEIGGWLQRLCRTAARSLPATGVGVSLMSQEGHQIRAAASDPVTDQIEELQFTLGEGPCIDSFASRRPVLAPDLVLAGKNKWLGYGPAAHDLGVRAVFAFPMQSGTARLGVLDVYRNTIGGLADHAEHQAASFAAVAFQGLVDAQGGAGPYDPVTGLDTGFGTRLEVFQAQGMLTVQLGISLEEAMARLRAHAYADGRSVEAVAADVVARRVVLERDTE